MNEFCVQLISVYALPVCKVCLIVCVILLWFQEIQLIVTSTYNDAVNKTTTTQKYMKS